MAAEVMAFLWRWTSGTISTNLDVIWEMSDKASRGPMKPDMQQTLREQLTCRGKTKAAVAVALGAVAVVAAAPAAALAVAVPGAAAAAVAARARPTSRSSSAAARTASRASCPAAAWSAAGAG